nr:hypothetical protein [Tanacetum cinerariifolium]
MIGAFMQKRPQNFALMAYTSQGSSSSDSEVHTCSKEYLKSYEALQKQYDQQREALNKSNLEIICYQMGLESLEARIVVHEKNEAVNEKDIAFLKYGVQVKDVTIKEIKNQSENALQEKDDLKLKLEKFETSSKNLTKLINSQISAIDKTGHGYDGQMNESNLNDIHVNECEVLNNVFDSRESDRMIIKSFNHLIKECDFYENKMVLNNKEKISGPEEIRPVWDNIATVNHQSKLTNPHPKRNFVPAAVLTKSGQVPVNAAKQSSHRAAASVSAARRVNTAASRPNVNNALPTTYSYFKAHLLRLLQLNVADSSFYCRVQEFLLLVEESTAEVIVNSDAPASIALGSGGAEAGIPLKTTEQKIARMDELKAKSSFRNSSGNWKFMVKLSLRKMQI